VTDWPGAIVVYAPRLAAVLGTYFTLIPEKEGTAPLASEILKVSVGIFERGPRGSLRTLTASEPVFVIVAATLRCSTLSTASGPRGFYELGTMSCNVRFCIPVTFKVKDGVAETATASDARARRDARRVEVNMLQYRMLKMSNDVMKEVN